MPAPVTPPRRPRHLMDPANLRASQPQRRDSMSTSQVQKWVMSVLVGSTVGHFALGLLIGAAYIGHVHLGAKIGLLVLGTVTGVLAVVAGRAIHGAAPLSAWPVLGVVPGLAAGYLMFGR